MSVEIVAEISNNHNGDRDRCGRLIDAAKVAGADACKFQCYSPDELVALRGDGPAPAPWNHMTMYELYSRARTPFDWFPKIAAHCERVGIPWFSSVFGLESLKVLEDCGCPRYKIAALDRDHDWECVTTIGKPVLVSTSSRYDCQWADAALWCPEGYPQTEFAFRFAFLNCRSDDDDYPALDGFSYHGTDPSIPAVAVAAGATIIEAHFMLDDEPSELEANISLGQKAFTQMVASVRATERLLG